MDSDAPSPLSAKIDTTTIDTTVPASARIWNYWLGGKDYYPVDKLAGDQFAQFFPGIFDLASAARHFIARVAGYLAGEAGIRRSGSPDPDVAKARLNRGGSGGLSMIFADTAGIMRCRA